MTLHVETRRSCLAFSPGGHHAELRRALEGIELTNCFHATFASGREPDPTASRTYFLCHPRRSVARLMLNAWQSLVMLLRERPRLVISSGADVAAATVILGKLLGAETIFIESAGSVEPTLTGRLVYPFCDLFIIQWPEQRKRYPRAVHSRGLLL